VPTTLPVAIGISALHQASERTNERATEKIEFVKVFYAFCTDNENIMNALCRIPSIFCAASSACFMLVEK